MRAATPSGRFHFAVPDTRPYGTADGSAGRAVVRQREPYRGRLLRLGAAHEGADCRRSASCVDCSVRCRYGHGGHLLPALSRGDRDAESVSGDRFPLRERHRQPAVRNGRMRGVPAVAGRRAISRRQGRIVAAGGIYRQAATQDDAERRAEVLHALSDTHAGIVRKDELQGRDRRAGTTVLESLRS